MRLKRVIILAATLLLFLPLGSAAQQPLRVAVLPFIVHSEEDLSHPYAPTDLVLGLRRAHEYGIRYRAGAAN